MIPIPEYLIKLSVSFVVLYVFYRLVLHRLTFYQWNRIYLLGYSLLSFVLPFINITPWIEKQGMMDGPLNKIPALGMYALTPAPSGISLAEWLLTLVLTGMVVLAVRMLISYLSLRQVRKRAVLWHADQHVRLFNTGARINPFSFGNSIYVNRDLHSEDELQRIIQHEMVHVKQKHTIDLVIGEFLAIVNWYNPFAWLIRNAIRQNLEFIADKNVLDKGYDKKEYQYLLLKVIGLPQYGIANNFSLPNLKKRIIMMNTMKTATVQLGRFLFALPLLSIVLLAFRNNHVQAGENIQHLQRVQLISKDTVPAKTNALPTVTLINVQESPARPNKKNYILSVANNGGEHIVIIKDDKQKIVKAITLADWMKDKVQNEKKYGAVPVVTFNAVNDRPENTITLHEGKNQESPLFVVDGVEQTPEFKPDQIPAANILSVNVLKGDAAIAKYGDRAKNGVVEIVNKPRDLKIGIKLDPSLPLKDTLQTNGSGGNK